MTRIRDMFTRLEKTKAFVAYMMAGDPNPERARALLHAMPDAGVDLIELGIPFTDPMADGPTIQGAAQRALSGAQTLTKTLDLVNEFRKINQITPIILMGYYNPIYSYGVDAFIARAKQSGVDGLIVVDLPPEEDDELCLPARAAGLDFIRLATPTTDDNRLATVLQNTSGFVYYVSMNGVTGAQGIAPERIAPEVARIKAMTDLPVLVGFGISTPESAGAIAAIADGCIVGSAIVDKMASGATIPEMVQHISALAKAVHAA